MALVTYNGKMEQSMKARGSWEKHMVMASLHRQRAKSMMESGVMIELKVMVHKYILIKPSMRAFGDKTYNTARGLRHGLMGLFLRDNTYKVKRMD